MKRLLLTLALALAASGAQAQIKCWNDANGKRVCGDAPPPGAKVTTLKTPAAPESAPAAKDGAKDKSRPLTPAEQDQAYRKRQADAQKASEKADKERKEADTKRDNCDRAKESLRTLEVGRVARTDSKGERYYLDEAQIAQEKAKAQQSVQQWCN